MEEKEPQEVRQRCNLWRGGGITGVLQGYYWSITGHSSHNDPHLFWQLWGRGRVLIIKCLEEAVFLNSAKKRKEAKSLSPSLQLTQQIKNISSCRSCCLLFVFLLLLMAAVCFSLWDVEQCCLSILQMTTSTL